MNEFFKLAGMLSAVHPNEQEQVSIQTLWDEFPKDVHYAFYEYCEKYKLAPWVFCQLRNLNLSARLEAGAAEAFRKSYERILDRNDRRNAIAKKVLAAFRNKGIEVVVLKGNYFAHSIYREVGYKRMNDFDVLVHQKDWGQIQDIYRGQGFIPLGFGWSGEKEKPAKYSHVGMSYISQDFSCIMGTQWGLKSPTTYHKVNMDEVWQTCVPFDFLGEKVLALSPEFNLLHLILHLEVYKAGIRDCMDLYNLQRVYPIDIERMTGILYESRAVSKARFALTVSDLSNQTFGAAFIDKLQSMDDRFLERRRKTRLQLFQKTGDVHWSYNDYFHKIEKQAIYFNLFPQFHIKFKIYAGILKAICFPDKEVALKLCDGSGKPSIGVKLFCRFRAPFIVLSLIAQEVGWLFTCLLLLKLPIDMTLSLKNYLYKKDSYFDYLANIGIDPEMIHRAVEEIQ